MDVRLPSLSSRAPQRPSVERAWPSRPALGTTLGARTGAEAIPCPRASGLGAPPTGLERALGRASVRTLAFRSRRGLSPLPAAEVRAHFDTILNDPDIPHHFVHEGCHFRAHVAARRLEALGVECQKIFAVPSKGEVLIRTPRSEIGYTIGMYHAAISLVEEDEARNLRAVVFDPALFDAPVPVDRWKAAMTDLAGGEIEILLLPRFALMPRDRRIPPRSWREEDIQASEAWRDDYRVLAEEMARSRFCDHLAELVAESKALGE